MSKCHFSGRIRGMRKGRWRIKNGRKGSHGKIISLFIKRWECGHPKMPVLLRRNRATVQESVLLVLLYFVFAMSGTKSRTCAWIEQQKSRQCCLVICKRAHLCFPKSCCTPELSPRNEQSQWEQSFTCQAVFPNVSIVSLRDRWVRKDQSVSSCCTLSSRPYSSVLHLGDQIPGRNTFKAQTLLMVSVHHSLTLLCWSVASLNRNTQG